MERRANSIKESKKHKKALPGLNVMRSVIMQLQTKTLTYFQKKINGIITISYLPEFTSQPEKEQPHVPFNETSPGVVEYLYPHNEEYKKISAQENNIALFLVSEVSKFFNTGKKD